MISVKKVLPLFILLTLCATGCSSSRSPVVVGAVYPTSGGQGMGGVEEFRGVRLAAEMANRRGGVDGRPIQLLPEPADSVDEGPGAVNAAVDGGAQIVVGSYGSTISESAARTASQMNVVFWETGAVGQIGAPARAGSRFFRVAPSGASLGRAAIEFVQNEFLPRLRRSSSARYGVVYVDDVYGRSVAFGALQTIRRQGLPLAGTFPYRLDDANYEQLARSIRHARVEVLFVSSYLRDAIAMRRALLREQVHLLAGIGTSSSYCMPAFGLSLGKTAVGLFASDKPDGEILRPDTLSPQAAALLRWARTTYRARYGQYMTAAALSGFASAWALFHHVLPVAKDLSSDEIAEAARRASLPIGALPNGSGVRFGSAGTAVAGENVRAESVIWEWVRPGFREVVWPPAFATGPIRTMDIG
ncbi:MAG TPA: ABC transporter substrate-binding protein [Actinomycetota bacterium]